MHWRSLGGGLLVLSSLFVSMVACGPRSDAPGGGDGTSGRGADNTPSAPYSPADAGGGGGRLRVVATFYPLYDFARQVGGERADVRSLVPNGVEPHDWEPSPQELAAADAADLFIYLGVGFEPWVDRVLPDLGARVKLEAARGVLDHRTLDPHVWLDPVRAQQMVDSIAEAYTAADPARASEYRSRAAAYRERLADLDTRYRDGLARCATRTVMTTHEAFGYLANRYGLELVPIMGLSPEAEPGPRRLAELRRVARERGVRAVFTEPLVSPRVAEALAAEIGAETLMLNPVEGLTKEEAAAGADYLAIMLENLRQLQRGLGCQP